MISQTKLKERIGRKENPEMKKIVTLLRKQDSPFWRDVATTLVKPKRQHVTVSLEKLNKNTKEGDTVLVPGKILSDGEVDHKLTLGAFSLSSRAQEKMKKVKVVSIEEMLKSNKNGEGIKIII